MSFSIQFQSNSSPSNQLDKSLSTLFTLTGTLRNESNIVNPTILVEYDGFIGANYFTISEFNRSYFITDIRSIRNKLWEVSGHVDVISSFKADLRRNTFVVLRQQNDWNLYLDDGIFKAQQNPMLQTKEFPNGFTDYEYVLATIS